MNIPAKVAIAKQKHPERFCLVHQCLWRVVKLDHETQTFSLRPDCPGGYCPRHAAGARTHGAAVLQSIRRAARTKGFFFAALRAHGVLREGGLSWQSDPD